MATETLRSTPGFASDTSLPSTVPRTPPYTPRHFKPRRKNPLDTPDSPASPASIQPTETISPAKKNTKPTASDDVHVEELVEGDVGYLSDLDVVHPSELEEAISESEDGEDGSSADESDGEGSDTGISREFSRLRYADGEEAEFHKKRHQRHLHKRTSSRSYKRLHSESVKSDTDGVDVDPDSMADHDNQGSARRMRRRIYGPAGDKAIPPTSSGSHARRDRSVMATEVQGGRLTPDGSVSSCSDDSDYDDDHVKGGEIAMDVDD